MPNNNFSLPTRQQAANAAYRGGARMIANRITRDADAIDGSNPFQNTRIVSDQTRAQLVGAVEHLLRFAVTFLGELIGGSRSNPRPR